MWQQPGREHPHCSCHTDSALYSIYYTLIINVWHHFILRVIMTRTVKGWMTYEVQRRLWDEMLEVIWRVKGRCRHTSAAPGVMWCRESVPAAAAGNPKLPPEPPAPCTGKDGCWRSLHSALEDNNIQIHTFNPLPGHAEGFYVQSLFSAITWGYELYVCNRRCCWCQSDSISTNQYFVGLNSFMSVESEQSHHATLMGYIFENGTTLFWKWEKWKVTVIQR